MSASQDALMRTSQVLALFACTVLHASAAMIAEWNFNSAENDDDAATGSLVASQGEGTFALLSANATFGSVGRAATSDPAASDNTQLSLRGLPRIDEANQSAGVEVTFSTAGFEQVSVSWDQYNSRTASRFRRLQYSLDAVTWTDYQVVTNASPSRWQQFTVDLSDVAELNDLPFVGIRLVQEFESTATGAGADTYVAVDPEATYSTAGSWWLDMITISARAIGASNSIPVISQLDDLQLTTGELSPEIAVTFSDPETTPERLRLTVESSDENVASIEIFEGAGTNRTLVLLANAPGESLITIRVMDEQGASAEVSFAVNVLPAEETPPENYFILWTFNSPAPDDDVATGTLEPSLGAGQFQVLATENFSFGSVGQSRTSDPAEADDSMLRISGFPPQGSGEATCGIEFLASTVGRANIALVWDQYNSSTASRHWRIQYTTNAANFIDYAHTTNTTASAWGRARAIRFHGLPGVEDNPDFGVRFVSEFAPDLAFAAVGANSTYSTVGTLWLDMVGLSGEALSTETEPPELTIISGPNLQLTWPNTARGFQLETRRPPETDWMPVSAEVVETETEFQVAIKPDSFCRLFRLRRPASATP